MADYRFETSWRLPASQSEAWAVLSDGEAWSEWWPSVRRVERLTDGAPNGVGRLLRYHFGTRLPYTLTFEARLVEVTEPSRLVAAAEGELAGQWSCDLTQDGGDVVLRHVWSVSTTRAWMNLLAPVAAPVFAWNHAALMREGGQGFADRLGTRVVVEGDPGLPGTAPALALAGGAAALVLWLVVRARRHG